jgi:hypothetical protein
MRRGKVERRLPRESVSLTSKKVNMPVPEIALIAITRVALGIGIGLLLSNMLTRDARRAAGLALLATGVFTTVPLALRMRDELR